MTPVNVLYALWLAWIVSWHVAMLWTSRSLRRDESMRRPLTLALAALGFAVLLGIYRREGSPLNLWTASPALAWAADGALALCFAFMWWARIHLGRLWSASIVIREGHRVIASGPYALVRHPIYTGLIGAALCTLIVKGTAAAAAGFVLILIAFTLKARAEEKFLRKELGPAYDDYARRVPMLVPFGPKFS